ncbi:MAG: gliding motility-associated ABC transporter substrate-binding protein GldG, partial [Saprospiraceae bacterium]
VDRLNADIDSIQARGVFVPSDYPLNIEDMLFKYGARIQPDLVLDMECTSIPLVAGMVGNAPDIQLFPWYYFPAVQGQSDHPVVKNLDRVELRFCSSIDTVRTRTAVVKTPLLYSSKYSRLQFSPISLNFQIAQLDPDPSKFNKGPQLTALLLEGEFASNYENRVSEEMARDLEQAGVKFSSRSAPTRMIVVSDGDVTANHVRDAERREWLPLGFNRFERIAYANKDFMLNAIEYLIEPRGVVLARSKEIKLRMLDTVRAREEKLFWQALNLGVPLAFLSAFGLFFHWRRRRMYAR